MTKEKLQKIGDLFRLPGNVKSFEFVKEGSTTSTYKVEYDTKRIYAFQKMKVASKEIFEASMKNVDIITSYLKDNSFSSVHFRHTNDKGNYIEVDNEIYRVRRFFDSFGYNPLDDEKYIENIGYAISSFQYFTKDFDISLLTTNYPNLYNVSSLLEKTNNKWILDNKEKALLVNNANLDKHVTHNDSRIKTFMLHGSQREFIDLDLVQPGIRIYDFAGVACLLATTTNFGEVDNTSLDLIKLRSYLVGYLKLGKEYLSEKEISLLADAMFTVAIENALTNENRLTKYNWCIALAKDIDNKKEEINKIIKEVLEEVASYELDFNKFDRESIKISDQSKELMPGDYMKIIIPHKITVKGGKCYAFFKRCFDIFASLMALIVFSPILLIVGLLVKLTSKGPMIYVSKRVGKNGRIFKFYKYRSMYKDAESRLQELLDKNEIEGGITFKMKDDPRITPFGKFIRKTSLDELPQLVNILKGDMSIIGPRVGLPREVELYPEEALDRLLVPQGLSGEWQANGRSDTTFENMIKMDLDYISNKRSFWYDIKLIFKTVLVVLLRKGAE